MAGVQFDPDEQARHGAQQVTAAGQVLSAEEERLSSSASSWQSAYPWSRRSWCNDTHCNETDRQSSRTPWNLRNAHSSCWHLLLRERFIARRYALSHSAIAHTL